MEKQAQRLCSVHLFFAESSVAATSPSSSSACHKRKILSDPQAMILTRAIKNYLSYQCNLEIGIGLIFHQASLCFFVIDPYD